MERIEKSTAGLPDGWHVEAQGRWPQLYHVFANGVCVAWAFNLHYSDELHVISDDPSAQKVIREAVAAHKRAVEVQLRGHWSDCAVHNEPAYPNGPCDCGGFKQEESSDD